jgi:hypothetical protein
MTRAATTRPERATASLIPARRRQWASRKHGALGVRDWAIFVEGAGLLAFFFVATMWNALRRADERRRRTAELGEEGPLSGHGVANAPRRP